MKIAIDYLKRYPQFIEEIAEYFYEEWGYLIPERGLQGFVDSIMGRLNIDRIPFTLVAVSNGVFLGTVGIKEYDMDTRKDLSPWLAGLYVRKEYRNNSIGRILIENVIRKAKWMGICDLHLYTPSAENYYRRLNWEVVSREIYLGTGVVIMKKTLMPRE